MGGGDVHLFSHIDSIDLGYRLTSGQFWSNYPHHEMGDFERSEIDSVVVCDLSEFYI
jgi:hypothetical protein